MAKKSFRVYFVTHSSGQLTGILMRTWSTFFDASPPQAFGQTEDEVFQHLEVRLQELEATGKDRAERYLWDETFQSRMVTVDVHPQTAKAKRIVIGKKRIPLRLTYAFCKMKGGYRVMLPRFDWWFIVEDLDVAPEVLRNAVSSAMLGEKARWVYDFRREGEEFVREWAPRALLKEHEGKANKAIPGGGMPAGATLPQIAEELVDKTARGKAPPVVAAGATIDLPRDIIERVGREPPPSILLVGPPGAGKSTWVRRLARLFAVWKREEGRPQRRIWASSGERIIAGMVYLGMWQERCLKIINELGHSGDYLFVDRLTSIMRAQPDGASIAEILMPAVVAEEISIIAECTSAELEKCQRRMPEIQGAFHIVRVDAPPPAAMPTMLASYAVKKGYGDLKLQPSGLKRAVQHLDRYQRDTAFPGKAFRFIDWLAQDPEAGASSKIFYPPEMSAAYARFSGLPLELISDDHPASAASIAGKLRERVIGQDAACEAAAHVLARFKAGLNDPEKPTGSLFFVGPTGVGKTELAKQLARTMFGDANRMHRFDMSEYMMPGAAMRMLEVESGATSLAQRVRQQPLSLILLDEIEKAHPEVFDLLLGILGEGRLTDSLGRLVDFRATLIVMTSNLGAREGTPPGFGASSSGRGDFLRSVRDHFRPEFFNRIDKVISFRGLDPDDVLKIVDLELDKAQARTGLLRRNLRLDVELGARRRLAELGFHPTRGARPLTRVIEERVITPVAVRMARDPAFRDRSVVVVEKGATGDQIGVD